MSSKPRSQPSPYAFHVDDDPDLLREKEGDDQMFSVFPNETARKIFEFVAADDPQAIRNLRLVSFRCADIAEDIFVEQIRTLKFILGWTSSESFAFKRLFAVFACATISEVSICFQHHNL